MSEEGTSTKGDKQQAESDENLPTVERVMLTESEKGSLSKDEWAQKWLTMESYVDHLEEKIASMEGSKPDNWCFLYKATSVPLFFCLLNLQYSNQDHIT